VPLVVGGVVLILWTWGYWWIFRPVQSRRKIDALVAAVANLYCCEPEVSLIKKYVFKFTDCGAFIHFDDEGIVLGTIVEGSDAEYHERLDLSGLDLETDKREFRDRFFAALERCEKFSDEVWAEMESEDSSEPTTV
jgi:hypothetical protein